jgi:Tol biopolymer transport system component
MPDVVACFDKTKGPFGDLQDYKWSPDSRSLAGFVYTDIVIFDLATKQYRTLLQLDDLVEQSLAWSPDGTEIAYTKYNSTPGKTDIYISSVSMDSNVRQITHDGRSKSIMFWVKIP